MCTGGQTESRQAADMMKLTLVFHNFAKAKKKILYEPLAQVVGLWFSGSYISRFLLLLKEKVLT
jgi:hypothetical protein